MLGKCERRGRMGQEGRRWQEEAGGQEGRKWQEEAGGQEGRRGQEARRRKRLRGWGAGEDTDCFSRHHTMDTTIALCR